VRVTMRSVATARIRDFLRAPLVAAACLVAYAFIAVFKPFQRDARS
jgi:hypothetical protein